MRLFSNNIYFQEFVGLLNTNEKLRIRKYLPANEMQSKQILNRRFRKQPLQVTTTKPPTSTDLTQRVILIEWNLIGEQFINNVTFHSQPNNLRIHIFFNKTEKENMAIQKIRENFGSCVTFHESLTKSADAAWTDLLAYIINFYTKTLISCHHCSVVHPRPKYQITLVASQEARYTELKALLKSNKADTNVIDGWKATILNIFEHVCPDCKIVFSTKHDAEKHDKDDHNFLCSNKSCKRNKRENGFFSNTELTEHAERQQSCQFCSHLVYCDVIQYNEHMDKYHIICSCPCGRYYRNTEDFIEHYCGVFPLPCLENPECGSRFKNIDEQAFHHKTAHGSAHPYFCIACFGQAKLVCLRTSEELMAHVSASNHKENDFEVVMIPEEEKSDDNVNKR